MIFDIFCFNFGAAVAKIFNKYKKISPEKSFGNSEFCSSLLDHNVLSYILRFRRDEQNSEFPKHFFGGYLFVFVEYLCNRSFKIKTKTIKSYVSILTIVNHRNWQDDSHSLTAVYVPSFEILLEFGPVLPFQ